MSAKFNVKTIKPYRGFKQTIKPHKKKKGLWIAVVVLCVAVILLIFNIFSKVKITIVPETKNIEQEFEIQLTTDNSQASQSENFFVAEKIEVTKKVDGKFEATGEKDIGDKATGQAKFFNLTGRSQPLTNQIELVNQSGIVFTLKENITIPSAKVDDQGNIVAGEIITEITAQEPGEEGNVGPGRINISALAADRQEKVYGEIVNSLTGGNSEMTTVVSQEDLDNAQDELFKQIEYDIREEIEKKAGKDMYVTDELIEYENNFSKSVELESETEDFEASLETIAQALVYDNKELRLFLKNKILESLPEGQTISETEFGNLEIQEVTDFDIELGLAKLKLKAIFPVAESIDLTEVKQNILGKKEYEARRYILGLPNVKNVKFDFSMNLTTTIPKKESRVEVKLGEVR